MDPIQKRELKRKAWMRLAAQKRRAGLLRGRVIALSLICFALFWGTVFVQMATGNDPVLSGKETVTAGRTTASADKKRARERRAAVEARPEREFAEVEAEPEVEFEEVEAEPEFEEVEPEAQIEEVEPEFVEEPLVTSQS